MSPSHRRETLRRPRYRFSENSELRTEIDRSVDQASNPIPVALLDLSRNGFQVKTPVPLEPEELVTLHLWIESSGYESTMQGSVRWQRAEEDGMWVAGCLLECPLELDALGELFLAGILSTDGP